MTKLKTHLNDNSVEDFIKSNPSEQKQKDGFVILEMMKKITKLKPKMWGPSIIGFGSYHYKYESGREGDMPLLAFSPRKQRLVFYVLSQFDGQDELLSQFGKYKTGKICLYINKLADVDMDVLEKIIIASWKHALTTDNHKC